MAQKTCGMVIFGCGNLIMGNDSFSPAVIKELNRSSTPSDNVDVIDFTCKIQGNVFSITPHTLPATIIHDFSLLQFPTVNLVTELAEYTDIGVDTPAAQVRCPVTENAGGCANVP